MSLKVKLEILGTSDFIYDFESKMHWFQQKTIPNLNSIQNRMHPV